LNFEETRIKLETNKGLENQITTITFFKCKGFVNCYYAFSQVALAPSKLRSTEGLTFVKSMGSGGGKGFDLAPSFSNYCWLLVWENESYARNFFRSNPYFLEYSSRCSSTHTLFLENIVSKGFWSSVNPFISVNQLDNDSQVVVLTRARIKTSRLLHFWLKAGKTAQQLNKSADLIFAIGVGELPLIQQATISIWKNLDT
jgi:hypothetical protein